MRVILKMVFLTFSNIKIYFYKKKLACKSYTIVKASIVNKQIKLIDKKKLAVAILDKNIGAFLIYVNF